MREPPFRRFSRLLFRLLAYRPPALAVPPPGLTLADVTVVNPGQERRPGQTLVVSAECIAHIATAPEQHLPTAGLERCTGAYVLPGLIDMHVHIPPPCRELCNVLFLAHGVTTVRETGDADGSTWGGRRRIRSGRVPGPRIFASGPVLDGAPPFLPTSWVVRDAAAARAAVHTLADRGADCIKIHHKLSAEALAAVRLAARTRGLRVVGHIPGAVPFERAYVWDVQHLDGLVPYPQPGETVLDNQRRWRDLADARIDSYVRTSVEQELVHTPTLVTAEALLWLLDPGRPDDPAVRCMPRYIRDAAWSREHMPLFRRFSDEALRLMEQALARNLEVVRRLHAARVRLHLGTDTAGMPFVVPGASLHEELRLMVRAGLALEDAWAAGTRAAGASLRLPGLGTIQEGAPADLAVFREDPTRDLAALDTLVGVVAAGRFYSREYLEDALARHRACFERPLYDRLSTALVRLGTRMMVPR